MNISINHLYTYCNCQHRNIGVLKNYCQDFSISNLTDGVNLLECPLNGNGWALTNCICNSHCCIKNIKGDFYINDEKTSLNKLRIESYYICQDDFSFLDILLNRKVKHLILGETNDAIGNLLFEQNILNRNLNSCGNWKYIVSFYIGYKKGKKIFGFPWLKGGTQMEIQSERLKYIHNFSVSNHICVILPCECNSSLYLNWSGYSLHECE